MKTDCKTSSSFSSWYTV